MKPWPAPRDDKPDSRIITGGLIVLFVVGNAIVLYSCVSQAT